MPRLTIRETKPVTTPIDPKDQWAKSKRARFLSVLRRLTAHAGTQLRKRSDTAKCAVGCTFSGVEDGTYMHVSEDQSLPNIQWASTLEHDISFHGYRPDAAFIEIVAKAVRVKAAAKPAKRATPLAQKPAQASVKEAEKPVPAQSSGGRGEAVIALPKYSVKFNDVSADAQIQLLAYAFASAVQGSVRAEILRTIGLSQSDLDTLLKRQVGRAGVEVAAVLATAK